MVFPEPGCHAPPVSFILSIGFVMHSDALVDKLGAKNRQNPMMNSGWVQISKTEFYSFSFWYSAIFLTFYFFRNFELHKLSLGQKWIRVDWMRGRCTWCGSSAQLWPIMTALFSVAVWKLVLPTGEMITCTPCPRSSACGIRPRSYFMDTLSFGLSCACPGQWSGQTIWLDRSIDRLIDHVYALVMCACLTDRLIDWLACVCKKSSPHPIDWLIDCLAWIQYQSSLLIFCRCIPKKIDLFITESTLFFTMYPWNNTFSLWEICDVSHSLLFSLPPHQRPSLTTWTWAVPSAWVRRKNWWNWSHCPEIAAIRYVVGFGCRQKIDEGTFIWAINQSINQLVSPSINQSTDQSINQSIDRSIGLKTFRILFLHDSFFTWHLVFLILAECFVGMWNHGKRLILYPLSCPLCTTTIHKATPVAQWTPPEAMVDDRRVKQLDRTIRHYNLVFSGRCVGILPATGQNISRTLMDMVSRTLRLGYFLVLFDRKLMNTLSYFLLHFIVALGVEYFENATMQKLLEHL